jgi:hypothetical protein
MEIAFNAARGDFKKAAPLWVPPAECHIPPPFIRVEKQVFTAFALHFGQYTR